MRLPDGEARARREIRREMEAHRAERADELVSEGLSRDEAEVRARREFGDARAAEDEVVALARRRRRWHGVRSGLSGLLGDFAYAVRSLVRAPTYSVAAVLTVAAGVGAATAVWSVVDGVLLRPLPYPDADRVAMVWSVSPQDSEGSPSWPDYRDWRGEAASFSSLAYVRGQALTHLDPELGAARINTAFVSPEYVEALAAPTHLGTLAPLADAQGPEEVIALKHSVWRTRFGADSSVVGRVVPFSDGGYRVVAVLAPGVDFPLWADGFARLDAAEVRAQGLDDRGYRLDTRVVGRLEDGVSLAEARVELEALAARLAAEHPATNQGWSATARSLRETLVGPVERSLWVLLAGVGALLLIACANVASLSLARTLDRGGELGLRASLGASAGRLFRLLLMESVVVAGVAGALGVLLARWGVAAFLAWGVPGLPRTQEITVDGRVLLMALAVSAAAGVLSGSIPAALGARTSLRRFLGRGAGGTAGHERLRAGLVGAQVAVTVVLLAATGLLARSFQTLQGEDGGVRVADLVTLRLALPAEYTGRPDLRRTLFRRILAQARAEPGIADASLVNHLPLSGTGVLTPVRVDGGDEESVPTAWLRTAGPGFFDLVGIPLVRGRGFEPEDHERWAGAVVVSRTFARQLWGDEDPLGRRLTLYRQVSADPDYGEPVEGVVVGVAEDTRSTLRADGPTPAVYLPLSVHPWPSAYLVVRPMGGGSVVGDVQRAVGAVEPRIPVADIVSYATMSRYSVARDRFLVTLTGVFAALAVFLSLVGTYGALAYAVRRRSHAMAIEVALGSDRSRLTLAVLRRAAFLVGGGAAVGILGALVLTRFLDTLLYEVSPLDPLAFGGSVLLVGLMGLAGAWLPARRAARADPAAVLRE